MALTDNQGADIIINTIDEKSATKDLGLLAHGGGIWHASRAFRT